MAKKESKKSSKVTLERVYNVPLRKQYMKKPHYKRTKKAVKTLREFVIKHMKSENVKVDKYVNLEMWKHGIKNPPHHIKVVCKKFADGKVTVELDKLSTKHTRQAKKIEKKEKEIKKVKEEVKKKETKEEKKVDKLEKQVDTAKEVKQEKAKVVEKKEIEQLKKDLSGEVPPKAEPKLATDSHVKTEQFVTRS